MTHRMVTFIGTGGYTPVAYQLDGAGASSPETFVQAALAAVLQVDEVIVLESPGALSKHGAALRGRMASWPTTFVAVPDGTAPPDQDALFQAVVEAILNGNAERVTLDITHGFRSAPFFASSVVAYLGAIRPKLPIQVVYGAFEARVGDLAPVWELTRFTDLLRWTNALHVFLRTGVTGDVARLAEETARAMGRQHGRNHPAPSLAGLAARIRDFGDDLATIRTGSLLFDRDGATPRLRDAVRLAREDAAQWLPPLAAVLGQIDDMLVPLSCQGPGDELRAVAALARLYLGFERYPEAIATIREGWVSSHGTPVQRRPGAKKEDRLKLDEAWGALVRGRTIGSEAGAGVTDVRNDIEHAGYQDQAASGRVLRKQVEERVEAFERRFKGSASTP